MKKTFLLLFLSLIITGSVYSQSSISVQDLLIEKELNPQMYLEAKAEAKRLSLPISITFEEGILVDVIKKADDGSLLYVVFTNLAHPEIGAELQTIQQVYNRFDMTRAKINYGRSPSVDPPAGSSLNMLNKVVMVTDWTDDKVMAFSPVNGDIVNLDFIPANSPNLQSPKEAVLNNRGFVTVSDQISDAVQKYDTTGVFLNLFAPSTGVNPTILDNVRGHAYRSNGNLLVANAGSGGNNVNAIVEFDLNGNVIGQFITSGSGGLNSPFGIAIRTNDILVTGSGSDAVHRYSLTGTYTDDLITGINFPQQVVVLPNGNIAVSVFSTPSGLYIYSSTGTLLNTFTGITGNRGAYLLSNGNYLATNGTGIHELDGTTGSLVRTILTSSNLQYVTLFDPATLVPVELKSFSADISGNNVILNWMTATETNNRGFYVERMGSSGSWTGLDFITGAGTTTEVMAYSYTDKQVSSGKYSYRLKQVDFDGSVEYSQVVEADLSSPMNFILQQNYPNPFNPSTVIKFSIPSQQYVSLKIFNELGEEVVTLLNSEMNAGGHEISFNASGLAGGIYFYRLTSGSYSESRKMLYLK